MYRKQMNKNIIIALWIAVAVIATVSISYYIYNTNTGNNEYCQSLMKQKNISNEYNCKITKEYQQDGKNYVDITVQRSNNVNDQATYSMEKETKTIK